MNVKLQKQFLSSQFSGAWTPSFFEFTGKLSKIQHTPGESVGDGQPLLNTVQFYCILWENIVPNDRLCLLWDILDRPLLTVCELLHIITVRKWSCGKVMFSEACVKNSVNKRGACMTGAACMVGGGMVGACVAGVCMVGGAWKAGGVCRGHAWLGVHVWSGHAWQKIRLLQRTVRILLECILVEDELERTAWALTSEKVSVLNTVISSDLDMYEMHGQK